MFYEHQVPNVQAFEEAVHLTFWERRNGQPLSGPATGDPLDDLVGAYKRLRKHFKSTPDVKVALDITEEEAWIGVACEHFGLGLFYRVDADGSTHVWTSVNGDSPDLFGYEALMRRIRTVFGTPLGITEHKTYVSDHVITRLLGGPTITSCLTTEEAG